MFTLSRKMGAVEVVVVVPGLGGASRELRRFVTGLSKPASTVPAGAPLCCFQPGQVPGVWPVAFFTRSPMAASTPASAASRASCQAAV